MTIKQNMIKSFFRDRNIHLITSNCYSYVYACICACMLVNYLSCLFLCVCARTSAFILVSCLPYILTCLLIVFLMYLHVNCFPYVYAYVLCVNYLHYVLFPQLEPNLKLIRSTFEEALTEFGQSEPGKRSN